MSVMDNLRNAAKNGNLHEAIHNLSEQGMLAILLPEIHALKGCEHDTTRGHHKEGDVYKHTMLVLKHTKTGIIHQLAALLHDVGKPDTRLVEEDKVSFLGHAHVGEDAAEAVAFRITGDMEIAETVGTIVFHHMRPHDLIRQGAPTDKAVGRFVRRVGDTVQHVLDLAVADRKGNLPCTDADVAPYKELHLQVNAHISKPEPLLPVLSATEIMDILGIGPGPEVGKAMRMLKDNGTRNPVEAENMLAKGEKL